MLDLNCYIITRTCVLELDKNDTSWAIWASRALKGSSNIYTSEFEYTALAKETLCFCPPLILTPLSPISVKSRPWKDVHEINYKNLSYQFREAIEKMKLQVVSWDRAVKQWHRWPSNIVHSRILIQIIYFHGPEIKVSYLHPSNLLWIKRNSRSINMLQLTVAL